ncbi:MAG: hypothetical protein TH68_09575, partial [Candidatus Synechococcus spongiarum 142]
ELNGEVTVTVETGTGYTVSVPPSATVTVEDDDKAMLKVEIPPVSEGEIGGAKLTLNQAATRPISINSSWSSFWTCDFIVCPEDTSIVQGEDFRTLDDTEITFEPGEITKTLRFMANDDSAVESTELLLFYISDLGSDEITLDPSTPFDHDDPFFTGSYWFGYIYDNDNPNNPNITITPNPSPVIEGETATFTVTATPAPT